MDNRKRITINGLTIYRIFAYFIIYSFLGYLIEMSFSVISTGILESRQSFLYGPFCGIYGLGATLMITSLHKLSKKKTLLFILGFIVGSITEFVMSYMAEIFLGVKWWDYSSRPFNIDGRICIEYSIFWGILALVLIKAINPYIDEFLNYIKTKFPIKILRIVIIVATILIIIDFIISMLAVALFQIRIIVEYDLDVKNKEKIETTYNIIYGNKFISNFINTFWGNKKMIRTYPNLKLESSEGETIYLDNVLRHIKRYYYKFK